jgi:hypothetical protein
MALGSVLNVFVQQVWFVAEDLGTVRTSCVRRSTCAIPGYKVFRWGVTGARPVNRFAILASIQ